MKKSILAVIGFLVLGIFSFAEEKSVVQGNNQNVTVNINLSQEDILKLKQNREKNSVTLGLGITTPLLGTAREVYEGDKLYTKSISGINMLLGFTSRNYLGQGLPENGVAPYIEFGTVVLFVPFAGIGIDFKAGENVLIGTGFPDVIHFSVLF